MVDLLVGLSWIRSTVMILLMNSQSILQATVPDQTGRSRFLRDGTCERCQQRTGLDTEYLPEADGA
jgi:hypothetical protein